MTTDPNLKTLVKILIGAAWIDGKIQPEERDYLHHIAKEKGVADDPEIQPLLYEFRAVESSECYRWVQEYLGENPTTENCQKLIETISALIYSDGDVASEEARLLNRIQLLAPSNSETAESTSGSVLKAIQRLYKSWVAKIEG